MSMQWLSRFGAVCGVVLGLSLGVPGAVETFTGETAVTSFVVGLGAAFGAPALLAFQLRQAEAAGRFGAVAFAVNLIGLGLFTGVAFALNLVVFFLDPAVAESVLAGPTRLAVLGSAVVFVVGTVLFGVSMARSRVLPRIPAWGYASTLTALALLAAQPDSVLTSLVHVLACVSVVWLSLSVWPVPSRP
ncbi:hypothetical protein [Catellatospora bangladeshensis]|nr:hypothetical protein [Catellatospora bangladeshensis]